MLDLKPSFGDGAVSYLPVHTGAPLTPELTAAVTDTCAQAAEAPAGALVVLHLAETPSAAESETPSAAESVTPAAEPETPAWPGRTSVHLVNKWEGALRELERLPVPVVAVVEGCCGGPALELLLTADHRVGSVDAALRLPEQHGQIWPSMALHRLTQQIGVAQARHLVLFGTEITAEQALRAGLLDEAGEDLRASVGHAVKLVRDVAGSELAVRRRLLLDANTMSFEDALGPHLAACDRMLRRIEG